VFLKTEALCACTTATLIVMSFDDDDDDDEYHSYWTFWPRARQQQLTLGAAH